MKPSTVDYMAEDLGEKLGCIVRVRRIMRREWIPSWSKKTSNKMLHTGQVHLQFRTEEEVLFETGRMSLSSAKNFIAALLDLNAFGFIKWTKEKQSPLSEVLSAIRTESVTSPQKQSITC